MSSCDARPPEHVHVQSWLLANREAYVGAYLVSDDPKWAEGYVRRLQASGIDVLHNHTATPTDDLAALMSGSLIARAAVISQFSNLASIMSGIPLLSFGAAASPECVYETKHRALARTWPGALSFASSH